MGHLDEDGFAACLAPCPKCSGARFELWSYIDQQQPVMLAEAAGPPRWVHDGEKFVDGTYRIVCAGCGHVIFESPICPRCNAPGGLATALGAASRLPVPKRCPTCRGNELTVVGLVPAKATHSGGASKPVALIELGEDGFHVLRVECPDCGVIAEAGDACPLCAAPGPIRARP